MQFVTQCLQLFVVALTNFRWIALVFALMTVGCGSSAIKLQSAETGAFTQLLHDEVTSDARRKAHGMEAFVRGKSSDVGMLDPENSRKRIPPMARKRIADISFIWVTRRSGSFARITRLRIRRMT